MYEESRKDPGFDSKVLEILADSDWRAMRETLADELEFGSQKIRIEDFVQMCEQGTPWRNVMLIASIFSDDEGALLYDGTNTASGKQIRVAESIKVMNSKVKSTVACFGSDLPPK